MLTPSLPPKHITPHAVASVLMKLIDTSTTSYVAPAASAAGAGAAGFNDADDLTPSHLQAARAAAVQPTPTTASVRAAYLEKAQKLCSDILSLQRDSFSLRHLSVVGSGGQSGASASAARDQPLDPANTTTAAAAIHEGDLAAVEQFLLGCGVCGYSGYVHVLRTCFTYMFCINLHVSLSLCGFPSCMYAYDIFIKCF